MYNLFLLILCVLVTSFVGWSFLFLLTGRRGFYYFSGTEIMAISYLFGFGAITIQMFIISLFGIGLTRFNVLIPWVLAGMGCIIGYNFRRETTHIIKKKIKPFTKPDIVLICLIGLQTFYNFFRAILKPIESYDAVAIYGLKSKMIYLAGGIGGGFFRSLTSDFHGAHPDYPLLIPLSETWVYTFLGRFDDILVKAIFPLFYLSFILLFYTVLKRITKNRTLSLLFTFALASIKQFSDYSTIGVADLGLGIYFALALFYIYLWLGDRKNKYLLNISLASSVFSLWTKNEGTILALITIFILLFFMIKNLKKLARQEICFLFIYFCLVIIGIVSWGIFKNYHGLINENFNLSMVSIKNFIQGLNKIPAILYEYQKQLFGFKKWNIVWILFIFILLKKFRSAFSSDRKYITLTFFIFGLSYALMYIFSAVEIGFFVRSTGSRFLLHILPVAMFWIAVLVNEEKLIEDL